VHGLVPGVVPPEREAGRGWTMVGLEELGDRVRA
jgi:hypothetical protein